MTYRFAMSLWQVDVLRHIHSKKLIHRDVKPDNFMLGTGDQSGRVFCVDFGAAEKFIEFRGTHKPFTEDTPLAGTSGFMSANVLRGHGKMGRRC